MYAVLMNKYKISISIILQYVAAKCLPTLSDFLLSSLMAALLSSVSLVRRSRSPSLSLFIWPFSPYIDDIFNSVNIRKRQDIQEPWSSALYSKKGLYLIFGMFSR